MPDKPYENILAFQETSEVLLFKKKNYKASVTFGLQSSQVHPIVCVLDSGAGPNLTRAYILDERWDKSNHQREMLEIRSASDNRLKVSGTITLHLRMGEARIPVTFGVVTELVVPVLLGATYIDRFIKSIHPAERKIGSHHSPPEPVLLVHEAKSDLKENKLEHSNDPEEVGVFQFVLGAGPRFYLGRSVPAICTRHAQSPISTLLPPLPTSRPPRRASNVRFDEEGTVLAHMANNAYTTVRNCHSCALNRVLGKKLRQLKLFFSDGHLEYIGMDVLSPLPKAKQGNQIVVVMKNQYTKLTKAITTAKTNATTIARIFLEHWVENYGSPSKLLTDSSSQFVFKFFKAVCSTLGVNNITTTKYHPQTNGQAERFNSTIMSRLRHYVSKHQGDWDTYLFPLTNRYNVQGHRSIKMFPFSLALTRAPSGPVNVTPKRASLATHDDIASPMYAGMELVKHAMDPAKKLKRTCDWRRSDIKRTTTDTSTSPPYFRSATTYSWTGHPSPGRPRNVPPPKGITSCYPERKTL